MPLVALCLLFTACNGGNGPDNPDGKYDDYPYSTLTPEQQKSKLIAESDALLNKISDLPDQKAISLMETFAELVDISEPDGNLLIDFEKGYFEVNEFQGEYSWNATVRAWDFADAKGKIVFNFPSTVEGTTNNAKIELSGVGSDNMENINGDIIELPKELKAVISENGSEVAKIEVKAENPNIANVAKSASANASIGNYTIVANASKDGENKVNSTVKFSKGSDVLLSGTLSSTIDWEYINEYTSGSGYVERDTMINLDYQSFEVDITSNLALTGYVDIKNMNKDLRAIDKKYEDRYDSTWTEAKDKACAEEWVAAYNKYCKVRLVSRSEKYVIADLAFGVEPYEKTKQVWDDDNWTYVEVPDGYGYDVKHILVFNDKTEVDFEVFFGEGFEKVIQAWEDFFEKLGLVYEEDEPSDITDEVDWN
ncbi:hypothetical protein D0T49_00935 [Paludibacter sp. 221]|nr:hypothetical protein [Paludibacter sp. 221]